jgi:hypothetical protein
VGALALILLSLAVTFLRPSRLAAVVQFYCLMQEIAVIGVEGARKAPYRGEQLSAFFTWMNFLNCQSR